MRGLPVAISLIVVNVCAALENLEFKFGAQKFKVPLNRPIDATRVKGVDLADFDFSIPKLIKLLPSVAEDAHRTRSEEHALITRLRGDISTNRYKTDHQFPDANPVSFSYKPNKKSNERLNVHEPLLSHYFSTTHIPNNFEKPRSTDYPVTANVPLQDHVRETTDSPETTTSFPNQNNGHDSKYDVLNLNPATIEAQYPSKTSAEAVEQQTFPEIPLVEETKLYESVAIASPLAETAAAVNPSLAPVLHDNKQTLSEITLTTPSNTVTEVIKGPPPATIVKLDEAPPAPTLKTNLYLPLNETREIPITLHYITTVPVEKVTLLSTPKPNSLVTSPSIPSLPLFSEWRRHTSVGTPLPKTTPMPTVTALPDTTLMSETKLVAVSIPELDKKSNPVIMRVPVTSLELNTTPRSDTTPEPMSSADLQDYTTPLLVTIPVSVKSLQPNMILVSDTTPMPGTMLVPTTSKDPDETSGTETTPIPETSLEPSTSPLSALITPTVPDDTLVISNIESPISSLPPEQKTSKPSSTPRARSLVTSPLIASLPLFSEWKRHKRVFTQSLDISPATDTISVPLTSLELDMTPVLETTLEPMKSTNSDTTLVSYTMPEPVMSLESGMTTTLDLVKPIKTSPEADITLVPDTTPVPETSQDLDRTPVLDTMPAVTSLELDTTPLSVLIVSTVPDETQVFTNFASPVSRSPPVLVRSKPTPGFRPHVTSPLIASIPLLQEWRLHKSSKELDMTLVLDTTPMAVTSLQSDITPVLVTTSVPVISLESDKSLVSDTTPVSMTSPEPDTTSVSDTAQMSMTSLVPSTTESALIASIVPDEAFAVTNIASPVLTTPPVHMTSKSISTPKQRHFVTSPLIDRVPIFLERRQHKSILTPPLDTTALSETSSEVSSLVQESKSVSYTDHDLMTSTYLETTSVPYTKQKLELATSPKMETTISSAYTTEPITMPELSTTQESVIGIAPLPLEMTLDTDTILAPVTLPVPGITSMTNTAPVPITSYTTDTTQVSDTTPVPIISTGPGTLLVADTIIASGSDTTPVSETTNVAVSSPESLLPVLDPGLVLDTTAVIPLTSSQIAHLKTDTTVAFLGSETRALPLTSTTTTIPWTVTITNGGARPADKVTSRRPPNRTSKVPCVRRKSSRKKGKRCRKSRSKSLRSVEERRPRTSLQPRAGAVVPPPSLTPLNYHLTK